MASIFRRRLRSSALHFHRHHQPPPHVSRPRSVPPANPPAPYTATLPAHTPRAFTPPPAPFKYVSVPPSRVSNANPQHAPQAVTPRILPRKKVWRDARAGWNHAHPSLARALPRRRSGLARLRALSGSAPSWGCGAPRPSLRSGTRQRHRLPALAVRKPRTAAGQLPRARSRVAALRASAGDTSPVLPRARSTCDAGFRSPARESGAPRIVAAAPPRFARHGCVRLRLTPSPRSRRRAIPPAPFASAARGAAV